MNQTWVCNAKICFAECHVSILHHKVLKHCHGGTMGEGLQQFIVLTISTATTAP